jgi:hypothetical protein
MAVRESITEPAAKAAAGTLSDHPATTVMPRSLGAWPNLSMGVATNVIVMEVRFGSTQGRWPGEPILILFGLGSIRSDPFQIFRGRAHSQPGRPAPLAGLLTTLFHELLTFLLRRCPQRFPCDRRQAYLCSIDLLYVFQVLCVQWFAKMMFFRFAVSACMSLFRLIQTQAVHSVHLVSAWTVVVRSLELPKQKGSKQSGLGTGLHACRRFLSSFSRASTETIPRNEPARTKSTPRKVPSMHTYPDWLVACVGRGRGHLLPMSKCMLYLIVIERRTRL